MSVKKSRNNYVYFEIKTINRRRHQAELKLL